MWMSPTTCRGYGRYATCSALPAPSLVAAWGCVARAQSRSTDSRHAPVSHRFPPQPANASRPSKPSARHQRARKSSAPGSHSTCRNAGIANPARSCLRARCWQVTPSPVIRTSIRRCQATSAAAEPIRVFAPQSSRPPAPARRFEMKSASTEFRGAVSSTRRHFLKLTATAAIGGGLMLGFGLPARGEVRDDLTTDAPFAPNAFLRIDRAGKVTFVMPVIEMGQGTYTSLPMLIAEELEVDVDKVAIEHSPPDDKVYANPLLGAQLTGGSTSVRGTYVPLRRAGATARVMLVTAAAERWKVDASTCRARNGAVVHVPTGRTLGYGNLTDAAAKLPVPENVALKEPADFKLIGTPHRRLDSAGKVDGSARFGIDSRPPGMKFAVFAASPAFGGKLVSLDEAKAKAVPGVTQVVRLDDAVAIVATHTWAAKQGLAAAAPRWDAGPNAQVSTADIVAQLVAASAKAGALARSDGNAAAAIAHAAQKIEAAYEQPCLAHSTMERMT